MQDDLKHLVEQLSKALNEAIRDSDRIRGILQSIEDGGYDATITLAVLLGLKDQNTEIQKILYGPERGREKKHAVRRISAFDRRFLRALRIKLPD